ncbi:MAG: SDR family NAD(P)-dependent oxidoreductase, partial [Candidatus Rokuibacteriota bacterium]
MRLTGRTVVITGAAGGVARGITLAFAAEGASLVLGDVGAGLEAAVDEAHQAGAKAVGARVDVGRSSDMT